MPGLSDVVFDKVLEFVWGVGVVGTYCTINTILLLTKQLTKYGPMIIMSNKQIILINRQSISVHPWCKQ